MRRALRNGDLEKAAKVHPHFIQGANKFQVSFTNLYRPIEMLFRSSICFILSLYMAL
jgi:hypothetical protein